jgi:hypothetical protein
MDTPNEMADILENLRCVVCFELANNAVECLSCGNVFCKMCVSNIKCPLCRNNSSYKDSLFARKIISEIPTKCQKCEAVTTLGEIDSHLIICPERIFICRIQNCKRSLKKQEFHEHLNEMHSFDILNDFDEHHAKTKTNYFCLFNEKINKAGNSARRGTSGKFYCGERSDVVCSSCDGNCGPSNGCQCTNCAKLDIEFHKLPPGFILNHDGNICQFINENFYCGVRTGNAIYCSPDFNNCNPCSRMKNAKVIEFVKLLINRNKH